MIVLRIDSLKDQQQIAAAMGQQLGPNPLADMEAMIKWVDGKIIQSKRNEQCEKMPSVVAELISAFKEGIHNMHRRSSLPDRLRPLVEKGGERLKYQWHQRGTYM